MNIEEVRDMLNKGVCDITFWKLNGELRVLHGTRNLGMVPIYMHPMGMGSTEPEGVIRVFDLEAEGWRSFCFDSMIAAKESDKEQGDD
jgi:hypothetical protein